MPCARSRGSATRISGDASNDGFRTIRHQGLTVDARGDAASRREAADPEDWGPRLTVIVPVLDEERAIGRALDHLGAQPYLDEIIVVDGGSRDQTASIARNHPLAPRVVSAPRGRARQMNAGAASARGEMMLFLHADTRLPPGGSAALRRLAERRDVVGGNFAVRFDGPGLFPRLLGVTYAVQRAFGVFYGDSAMFARRGWFLGRGGFPDIAIMEDYEMARALVATRCSRKIEGPAVTSSRRWRSRGVLRTVTTWVVIRWLFIAGVSPGRLARLYRVVR